MVQFTQLAETKRKLYRESLQAMDHIENPATHSLGRKYTLDTLGKFPSSANSHSWPPPAHDLLRHISAALAWTSIRQNAPVFRFAFTSEAAEQNARILRRFGCDLGKAIASDPLSPLLPGTEFRPVHLLCPIFKHHPHWRGMASSLTKGAEYKLEPLSQRQQKQLLASAIAYGNHKGALKHKEVVRDALADETAKGWQLPLPKAFLSELPDVEVGPLGTAEQLKLMEDGTRAPSIRVAHDMTFGPIKGLSVNDRVDKESLPKLVYGHSFQRFINNIASARRRWPNTSLLMCKYDVKSAFRRIHAHPSLCWKSVVITDGILPPEETDFACAALRLTFGGRPNCFLFCNFSEAITDLANSIARCPGWDPSTLHSRHADKIQGPSLLPASVPFASARPLARKIQTDSEGTADVFVDDIFSCLPLLPGRRHDYIAQAVLLALEVLGLPPSDNDSLKRDDILSLSKALAEGTPAETLIVLGWWINTRSMLVSLPDDKYTMWTEDINRMIKRASHFVSAKELEQTLGRLQHAVTVFKPGSHFLDRLRSTLHTRTGQPGHVRLTRQTTEDLRLWLQFLRRLHQGISINLITIRSPDLVLFTDACSYQIGGYSTHSGRAWRWQVPVRAARQRHINFLEFLACAAAIWLAIEEGEAGSLDCILSRSDNTSAVSWLRKSNFVASKDQGASHAGLARDLATIIMDHDIQIASRWIAGIENPIADALSRVPQLNCTPVLPEFDAPPPESSKEFSYFPTPGKDYLKTLALGASRSAQVAVTQSTTDAEHRAWRRWLVFINMHLGSDDVFLDNLNTRGQHTIMSAFAQAIRWNHFSKSNQGNDFITKNVVEAHLRDVAKAFTASGRPDPRHTAQGKLSFLLRRQLRGFDNADPAAKRQQPIPFALLKRLIQEPTEVLQKQIFQDLVHMAFFWAMRSCEYLQVEFGSRKTAPVCLGSFTFVKDGCILPLDSPEIPFADSVAILFLRQKNQCKGQIITQHKTDDPVFSPVKVCARIVQRMLREGWDHSTPVYKYRNAAGKPAKVSSTAALMYLRDFVQYHPGAGLVPERVGTHSIRTSSAMAMVLNNIDPLRVMMIGRWRSTAFINYIREEVQEFSQSVATAMISRLDFNQHTIPSIELNRNHRTATVDILDGSPITPLAPGQAFPFAPISIW